jgi:hypothetical protein
LNPYAHLGRTPLSLSSHLQALKKKHQALSDRIDELQRNPSRDDLKIGRLKKEKLVLKQQITRLSPSTPKTIAAE